MHRFGDQIELRVDRRHLLLFFLGAVFWTLIAFFFGMLVSGNGKVRTAEKGLAALGWLDQNAQQKLAEWRRRKGVQFAFARRAVPTKPAVRRAAPLAPSPAAGPAARPVAARPAAAPPAAPPPAPRVVAAPGRKRGQWTYRIAARVRRLRPAKRLLKRLRSEGYKPKFDVLSAGRMHRITYGRFPTRAAAELVRKQLRERGHKGRASVIRVK